MNVLLVLAVDRNFRLLPAGAINSKADRELFQGTIKDRIVISGKKTAAEIPERIKQTTKEWIIVSRSDNVEVIDEIMKHDSVVVVGGSEIYQVVLRTLLSPHLQILYSVFDVETGFGDPIYHPDLKTRSYGSNDGFSVMLADGVNRNEDTYLNLVREVLKEGQRRPDRTGTGTISCFGKSVSYDLHEGFPLLTTKQVNLDIIVKELLWFIRGSTNSKELEEQGVKIWKGNSTREFLDQRGLTGYEEGDIGPGYGFQWRHAGETYLGCHENYDGQGVDQLQELINGLRNDPYSRRHIICSWQVSQLPEMALPPCHCLSQFYVRGDFLDCHLYQRSGDLFLGVPFNIASYAMLTYILADMCGYQPGKLYHSFGDVHIYENHRTQVELQLQRIPYHQPQLRITRKIQTLEDLEGSKFWELKYYKHHPRIVAEMAV